jgi:hypothetical protein
MADRQRRDQRAYGRSHRIASSSATAAAASAAVSGPVTVTPRTTSTSDPAVATNRTYRTLLVKGLAPDEAANLTAFLAGLPVPERPWNLTQLNRILFLRELARAGRFGGSDGATASA